MHIVDWQCVHVSPIVTCQNLPLLSVWCMYMYILCIHLHVHAVHIESPSTQQVTIHTPNVLCILIDKP